MALMNFTIGCDPEFFIAKGKTVVPAHGVVPGTKESPFQCENGAMQVDGLALEVNINPVSLMYRHEEFNRRIVSVIKQTKAKAAEVVGPHNIMKDSVAVFDQKVLDALPDEAKVLGCDPDYCAYTEEHNPRPDGDVPFRATGGHIHVGWEPDNSNPVEDPEYIALCADFVKVLDLFIGIYLKILDPEERRRQMYGKAGAFRPKGYGLEYRSPSSWWIHTKTSRLAIYELTAFAVSVMECYGTSDGVFKSYTTTPKEVQSIIDTGTRQEAYDFYMKRVKRSSTNGDKLIAKALKEGL